MSIHSIIIPASFCTPLEINDRFWQQSERIVHKFILIASFTNRMACPACGGGAIASYYCHCSSREDKIRQCSLMYMCEEELQRYWRLADCTWIEESTADPPLYGIEKERISWSWKKTVQKAGGNSWVLDTPSLHIKFNQAIPTGNFVSFIS